MSLEELNNTIIAYDNIIKYYEEKMKLTSGMEYKNYYVELKKYKKLKEIAVSKLIQSLEIVENSQIILNSYQEETAKMSI